MKRAIIAVTCFALLASPALADRHGGGHYWHHHHHYRGWGWGWAPIAGAIVIGGAITAAAVAERRAAAADMRRCALEFPSFEPRTGTYVNGAGEVRVCPYLY